LTKIPTELYIYVARRSSRGAFHTNIWANLTRKDTGEGIKGKRLLSFLDDVNISELYTADYLGYAGPFDINPSTQGEHATHIFFEGDTTFESCMSEQILLKVDTNLLRTEIQAQVTPVSGNAPLKIQANGTAYEIAPDGARKKPAYGLPLDLMVFDATSTRRLQPVKRIMTNPDGTFSLEYTFIKLGSFSIFVNFLGDQKYTSAWSNNGRTTTINVTGGVPLSFEKTISVTETIKFKWILSATEPTPPEGFERFPDLDLDIGVLGKYWAFKKVGS